MNESLFTNDIIFSAYKKFKHYFYYDNTSLLIKQRISKFEDQKLLGNSIEEIKDSLHLLMNPILNLQENVLNQFFSGSDTLNDNHIDYHLIPKKFRKKSFGFITNIQNEKELQLERINIFVDASVEVHLVSVLWLMFAGKYLKNKISTNNYAYELQINETDPEEKIVDGLRLYKPYFLQYQEWRDNAISKAEQLIADKKDVTILSLDIKNYFHTVDIKIESIKKDIINSIEDKIKKSFSNDEKNALTKDRERISILSNLLNTIHCIYAEKIKKVKINLKEQLNPLPIGLMSSGMLGNYYLRNFDKEIVDQLNPAYYGRYVDDLMFVFPNLSIEPNAISPINNFLDKYFVKREILRYVHYPKPHVTDIFFASNNNGDIEAKKLHRDSKDVKVPNNCKDCYGDGTEYKITIANKIEFCLNIFPNLVIQTEKVILHYFDHKESKAALNKFKKKLEDQRSEFRFLPDEDKITGEFDEEAFSLQYNDSINKFRSIQELSEDKYGASKFLAKKIFARNYGDKEIDEETDNQILTFFKGFVGLTFYSLWEKVATYFIVTNRIDNLMKFKRHILKSIYAIDFQFINDEELNVELVKTKLIADLEDFLKVSIAIPLALNPAIRFEYPNPEEIAFFNDCTKKAIEIRKSNMFRQALVHIPAINYTHYVDLLDSNKNLTNLLEFQEKIVNEEQKKRALKEKNSNSNADWPLELKGRLSALSPRYVYFHELNIKRIYQVVVTIDPKTNLFQPEHNEPEKDENNPQTKISLETKNSAKKHYDLINDIPNTAFSDYWAINYVWRSNKKTKKEDLKNKYFEISHNKNCGGTDEYYVDIKGSDKNETRDKKIAIANIKVDPENYIKSIREKPNLSRKRRQELFDLLNQAELHKSDVLVMPEVSVPFSWIKLLGYMSHKRNIAIIAGLEHWININGFAFNFMVTILPIKLDDYTTSIIKIRLKNHYAHDEKELLKGHRLLIPRDTILDYPKSYDLFHWRNVYFSVYNCFELADIIDRALFKSKVDFIVAAEFNRDVNYFSDIAGSWVRDVHCYFVQVNTSQYGDSRLIQPSKSYSKDLIQIKGGINSTILVGELKIDKLRDFQLVEYNLQKEEINLNRTDLKPTPPDFKTENVKIRINNESFRK